MAELEFTAKIATRVPDRLPVFAMKRPVANRRVLIELAASLGLPPFSKGSELTSRDAWLSLQDGPYVLAMNSRSGAFKFLDRRAWNVTADTRFAYKDEEAVDIARDAVRRARLVAEWRSKLTLGGVTHLRMQGGPPGGKLQPETLLDAGVVFRRQIEGVPVTGPGGILAVNISPQGSVVGVTRLWRELGRQVGRVKVVRAQEALARVRAAYLRRDMIGEVRVTRAEFGYFEAGPALAQGFIEPCYAFIIESVGPSGANRAGLRMKTVEVVPAVEKPRQRWPMRVDPVSPPTTNRVAAA